MMTQQEQVQESIEIVRTRKNLEAVIAWGHDSANCEIHQGVYLAELQLSYLMIEPESNWKEFVAGNCNMSYKTARRRIKASEWHTVFGIELEILRHVDASRLEAYRGIATEDNAGEILQDLLPPDQDGAGLSDSDMIAKWKGDSVAPEPDPKEPVVKILRVHCPSCDADFDAEVE